MSLFGGTNPSPERDPRKQPSAPRPKLPISEAVPMSLERPLASKDEMLEMLQLCGITPPEETVDYLWETLRAGKLIDLDAFRQSVGPLGYSLELCVSSRQELEWYPTEYCDTRSVVLSTKHREGSDLGALQNRNEGHPGLDDIRVELYRSKLQDHLVQCKVSWEYDLTSSDAKGIKWDLIRSIYHQLREQDLPQELPVAPGQSRSFHFLTLELDPFTVQVQPTSPISSQPPHPGSPTETFKESAVVESKRFDLSLKNPSIDLLTGILAISNSPQLSGAFVKPDSKRKILEHMLECLKTNQRLDVDELKACDEASPCLVFVREKISDGESFPPTMTSKVILRDYTSSPGELHLELESVGEPPEEDADADVEHRDIVANVTWRRGHPALGGDTVDKIRAMARPYTIDERYQG